MPILSIARKGKVVQVNVPHGTNLRQCLLEMGYSPYTAITQRANCGGRGLCATCGVWVAPEPEPAHWHDKAAKAFGYPRLSCQIAVDFDMTVTLLDDKLIWGSRQRKGRS